jgi:hypothetical protein
VRQALLQFEQYAAISSITLASVVSCSIKYQLESQGSLTSTKLPTAASITFWMHHPTLQLPSLSNSSTINDDVSSLLEISASQLESQCFLIEQQISLCEQFHSIKVNFSICEAYNLRLATELARLQADNLQLCKQITTTHDQERAALICSTVTAQFRRSPRLIRANAISPQAPPHLHVGIFSLLIRLLQLLLQTPTLRHVVNGAPSLGIFRLHLSPQMLTLRTTTPRTTISTTVSF